MKCLVKSKPEQGLWLEERPKPECGIDDVLIRVQRTGICGTDLHIWNWDEWSQETVAVGTVIGHEFAGEIAEVGSNVRGFQPGEFVSGEGHVVCGHCRNCLAGRRHLCAHTQGLGVNRDGAFAEYVLLPKTNVWRHHKQVDPEAAAIFDPLGNAVHTALTFRLFGEDVLITGAGPIGLMSIPVVIHAGARHVVVTDLNPVRLELAKRMGATIAVDPRQTSLEQVQADLGMLEGFDVGLEMSGAPTALAQMIENMSHGGAIAVLGIPSEPPLVDWNGVIFKSLTIQGIYGREMYETWYHMTTMLESGVDISPVITHRFAYHEFEKAFEVMHSGDCGKVILDWRDA